MARRRTRAETRTRYYLREEAARREWDTRHVAVGGDFLEESEIAAHLPEAGLGREKPDFLICIAGEPAIAVETKNDPRKLDRAIDEAIEYADLINAGGRHRVPLAVGAAGEADSGFIVEVRYHGAGGWRPLESHGYPLTTLPSRREAELALEADDGTTTVSIPASHEFIDAAMALSTILRGAKVEAPLRPKVIGALIVAMYQGEIDSAPSKALRSINRLTRAAIDTTPDLAAGTKRQLIDALKLSSADFDRLAPAIGRVIAILRRLNVRPVLQTDTDFLGMFYEAFLRYGFDNKSLGIVFTPRHITRFCADLLRPSSRARVVDIASGTGGFLVAAFDRMMLDAKSPRARVKVKDSIYGFETNPTVWALSVLNMFFRGDGKSHMELASCFSPASRAAIERRFTHAFLNPPFSQEGEPERDFLDAAMGALEPGGELAAVVYAGVFADEEHDEWRRAFLRQHTLLAMISLPEDLFYPTAAPTTIVIARAHEPQPAAGRVLMARIWHDGFEKLKSRRVEVPGSQLPEVLAAYESLPASGPPESDLTATIAGGKLLDGGEWSPQRWLPRSKPTRRATTASSEASLRSVYQAVAQFPQLADRALDDFTAAWADLPPLPLRRVAPVSDFFAIVNGRSTGEKNHEAGPYPYVSSGDATNSIVRLVEGAEAETFAAGGLSVTAFGAASIQPWPFMARGNGGSAVRVLIPRFAMSLRELLWFATQINLQRWRFFYARMAIKSRLEELEIQSPGRRRPDTGDPLATRLRGFRDRLNELAALG